MARLPRLVVRLVANSARGGPALVSRDPATGETVWAGATASAGDVFNAVSAAHKAFPAWATAPYSQATK